MTNSTTAARSAAVLSISALGLGLFAGAGAAHAAGAPADSFYTATNSLAGATIGGSTDVSPTHLLKSPLAAVAADGSVEVLNAQLTATRTGAVVVDNQTGVGRILDVNLSTSSVYAGDHAVVVRTGNSFSLVNPATGASTALEGFPVAGPGLTRTVTAVAATADGAVVATSDVTPPSTSGTIAASHIWKLTTGAPVLLDTFADKYVAAVATSDAGTDVLLGSIADDSLSHLSLPNGGGSDESAVPVTLPVDLISAELGYRTAGASMVPVLTVTSRTATKVYGLDGTTLRTFTAGSRVFVSAADLNNPASIANRLSKVVTLSGIANRQVVKYGTRVHVTATATATGAVPASRDTATLLMTRAGRISAMAPEGYLTLAQNTCLTAGSPVTTFATAAMPSTKCVIVAHKVTKKSFNSHSRAAQVSTTARKMQVQTLKKGAWKTVLTVKVPASGVAKFKAPRGAVRVVAVSDATHGSALLVLARR